MQFSERFGITRGPDDTWFDVILEVDNRVFIDPFMLERDTPELFVGSRDEVVRFFDLAFRLVAAAEDDHDVRFQLADRMLRFPEPKELRLGYTRGGNQGRGAGAFQGAAMLALIRGTIDDGLGNLDRWDRLPLFNEGIGRDLLSDISANVLKHRLIEYTQAVCAQHELPMSEATIEHSAFDFDTARWNTERVRVPVDETGSPILLVPETLVKPLPTMSWEAFRDWAWDRYGAEIAAEFGYAVKSDLNKRAIVQLARARRGMVEEFADLAESTAGPYPFAIDPDGIQQPYALSRLSALTGTVTLRRVSGRPEFGEFLAELAEDYRHFIEDQRGSRLLWNSDGSHRKEIAPQLVFLARAEVHCAYNDVHMTGEANLGVGPVDFEFGTGYSDKAVLEVKYMCNSKYWHGLETQLPRYMRASRSPFGHFLALAMEDRHPSAPQWTALADRTAELVRTSHLAIRSKAIDARQTPSASV